MKPGKWHRRTRNGISLSVMVNSEGFTLCRVRARSARHAAKLARQLDIGTGRFGAYYVDMTYNGRYICITTGHYDG